MSVFLILTLVVFQSQNVSQVASGQGFVEKDFGHFHNDMRRGDLFFNVVLQSNKEQGIEAVRQGDRLNAGATDLAQLRRTPSGSSLGSEWRFHASPHTFLVKASCGRNLVQVHLTFGGQRQADGSTLWPLSNQRDEKLVEGVARWLLASMDTEAQVKALKTSMPNQSSYIDQWAKKEGFAYQVDVDEAFISLSKGRQSYRVYLASDEAILPNGKKIKLGEFVRTIGDRPIITNTALAKLKS
jgi:hypothetical protein